jgi:hypothetical protein
MEKTLISSTFSAVSIKGYGIAFAVATVNDIPMLTVNTITKKVILIGDLNISGMLSFGSLAPGLTIQSKVGNSRVLEVSNESAYTSIAAAITAANALVPPPSNTHGVVIRIYPGIYIENNPLIVPEGIVIIGKAGRAPFVKIIPINADIVFDVQGDVSIKNIMILGSENATIGINCSVPGTVITVEKTVVMGCATGMLFDGAGILINVLTSAAVAIAGQSVNIGIHLKNGVSGNLNIANSMKGNDPDPFAIGLLAEGASTNIFLVSSRFSGTVIGLHAIDNANVDVLSSEFKNCGVGVDIAGGSAVIINGGIFINNIQDIDVHDTISTLNLSSASLDKGKITYPKNSDTRLAYFNIANVNPGFTIEGGLTVGNINQPTTSTFGEGGSSVLNMSVLTFEVTGNTFTDVTVDAENPASTSFTAFPELAANSSLYMGRNSKFWGCLTDVVGAITLGAGTLVFEYYNGAWTPFDIMVTQAEELFISYAQQSFTQIEQQQIRFGRIQNDWVETSIFSINKYWIRIRIVSAITISPILQLVKLHSSSTQINSSGFTEYFGKARAIKQIPYDINISQAANSSPSNQDIYLSDNLNFGNIENQFVNNIIDRTGMKFYLPPEIDTSFSINMVWSWFTKATGGNIQWTIRWGYVTTNDQVHTTTAEAPPIWYNEQSLTIIETVPAVLRELKTSNINISIPNMVARQGSGLPQDILVVTIERNGSSDSSTSDVVMMQIAPFYHAWCNGLFSAN